MRNIPPVTRYLLIANTAVFLLQQLAKAQGVDLTALFGLHFALAERFHAYQLVTYMFLHGSLTHLFFNMFSLWMFGTAIERALGARKFLLYFLVCGVGAGLCQELFQTAEYFYEGIAGYDAAVTPDGAVIPMAAYLNSWNTIGASGACYGVLLAYGMLFPDERLMLLIPPIPLKAKYFVAGYAVIELVSAYASNDNIAHFAHLGGMLFGWMMLAWWRRRPRRAAWGGWTMEPRREGWAQKLRRLFTGRKSRVTEGNARHTAARADDYDYNMRRREEEERMDEILDKVRRSGYDSLTDAEKRELFRISRK